jgi:CubicO group peptidase (beta-lactamase class C family)
MATTRTGPEVTGPTHPPAGLGQADLERAVREVLNRRPAVGLGLGVVRDGRLEYFSGHGLADIPSRTPITEDTVFRVGSITKTFTAITVMQLCERGLVDLDAPANGYLRAYQLVPAQTSFRPVTIRHLLTHTAGIPEVLHPSLGWWLLGEAMKPDRPVPGLAEFYADGLPVRSEPGTRFRYTDHGFATLGQIVEDVTGEPIDRYLLEHVFEPLGMTDTSLTRTPELAARLATGYSLGRRGVRPVDDYQLVTAAAGGAYSTIRDLARFATALMPGGADDRGRVLEPATLETMFQPHYQPDPRLPGEGLVFSRADMAGHPVVWHGGIVPDCVSQMWLAPDAGLAVLAFTNGSRLPHVWLPSEVARLLGRLLGAPPDAVRTDVPQHPEIWPELCGWYHLPADLLDVRARVILGVGIEVFVRHGRLMVRVLTPIPGAYRGFELHPDDEDDPYVFRVDLSRFGLPTARVVFSGRAGEPVDRAHFELHPLSLDKKPPLENPRLWVGVGLQAAFGMSLAAARSRGRKAEEMRAVRSAP